MPILPEDIKVYDEFIKQQVGQLRCLDFKPEGMILWHYTTGAGLQGILESGTVYATQVSCLNDSSEIRYASSLFKNALIALLPTYAADGAVESALKKYIKLIEEEPERPNHAPSLFFVSCFSEQEDDLSQWRSYCGGENGYAIGLAAARMFVDGNSLLARVNYDIELHQKIAAEIAEKTVEFFRDGLNKNRAATAEKWEEEFFNFWDPYISRLAPMVKDPGFAAEREYRIIHELQVSELMNLRFIQKKTMMSRHLPLAFPFGGEAWVPRLPIEKVIVGPCRHREITRVSVDTLMRKMGYGTGRTFSSKRPFQEP
jgi:hypothetical protein